jgi:glycosyltransferase involved in cell wall biosynthesis
MSRVSVVIPTHNRRAILARVLEGYARQSLVEALAELLVVDDGSTDGTETLVAEHSLHSTVPIRYFRQDSRGPAAARNLGIKAARGSLILLADDDIIPMSNLIAEHIAWHDRHSGEPIAVLGHVEWAPEVHPTPFMEWLGKDGAYFQYARLAKGASPDFRSFYSCNLSIGADFLKANGVFDEDFRNAAWEDIELGYRLQRRGLKILYNPNAIGFHHKYASFADARCRAEMAAAAYEIFEMKEAGIYLKELERREKAALPKPSWLRRMLKLIVYRSMPLFSPFLPILDSQIRLPWAVYRILYRYHVDLKIQRRLRCQS